MKRMLTTLLSLAALAAGAETLEERVATLENKVTQLEQRLQPLLARATQEENLQHQRQLARDRAQQDAARYSRQQPQEIETLYQQASRDLRSKEAPALLEQLVAKYPESNRAGCAVLYLAQVSEGDARTQYLETAIADHGDCFYFDGVQVGALARFFLAVQEFRAGEKEKAEALFAQIAEQYPDAVTHSGGPLAEAIAQLPKQ